MQVIMDDVHDYQRMHIDLEMEVGNQVQAIQSQLKGHHEL